MHLGPVAIICVFTFLIHLSESIAYSMRLSGIRTRQLAIAMSFVSSTLLVSRLSNMFQSPIMGSMVDLTVKVGTPAALHHLEWSFRLIICFAFLGSAVGMLLTPTMVVLFQGAMTRFSISGSLPRVALSVFIPRNFIIVVRSFRLPTIAMMKNIHLRTLPRTFLVLNALVTSIYTIGVLCSLLAGAYLPEMRSTANQLSGIVNGIATILFTLVVDPSGARITDEVYQHKRPESDIKSVIFFLLLGRLVGTLILAQIVFLPFTHYIMWVTMWMGKVLIR